MLSAYLRFIKNIKYGDEFFMKFMIILKRHWTVDCGNRLFHLMYYSYLEIMKFA